MNTEYVRTLRQHIDQILSSTMKDPAMRKLYTSDNVMPLWVQAFTHETYDATSNYERLETLGDALLKSVFVRYLMKRYPTIPSRMISELNIAYMSKKFQAGLSDGMQLSRFIRAPRGLIASISVREDLFESFFGALYSVSEKINPQAGPGLGFINCYNYIVFIFNTIKIDLSEGYGPPKTQVLQIFTRFELPKPILLVDEISKSPSVIVALRLDPSTTEFLSHYGINMTSNILATAEGPDKKLASDEVYLQALTQLEKVGITTEWAETEKNHLDMSDPQVQPYLESALKKSRLSGFTRLVYSSPASISTRNVAVYQLIGVRENGSRQILGTEILHFSRSEDRVSQNQKIIEARGRLMQSYAST